jgi:hypothetical protein
MLMAACFGKPIAISLQSHRPLNSVCLDGFKQVLVAMANDEEGSMACDEEAILCLWSGI